MWLYRGITLATRLGDADGLNSVKEMVIYELHLLMGANAAAAGQKLSVAPISDTFFAYESFLFN